MAAPGWCHQIWLENPRLNGGLNIGKSSTNGPFSIAVFDHCRVVRYNFQEVIKQEVARKCQQHQVLSEHSRTFNTELPASASSPFHGTGAAMALGTSYKTCCDDNPGDQPLI